MKMRLLTCSTAFICAVFIITGAVSGEAVKKAVGESVSFRPDKLEPTVTSITWKQIFSSGTVKVIEWDPEEKNPIIIPHPRFKDITSLDEKTGVITITNLKLEHSGTYTIDISSKEQTQRFSLEVMEPVPKPKIIKEESNNPNVAYLRCEYSGTIIWKNSAGETLEGQKNHIPGEFIKVEKTRDPENFYTCSFKNAVSEEISDRVYEKTLFVEESNSGLIAGIIVFFLILLLIGFICAYFFIKSFYSCVYKRCPCIESALNNMDCYTKWRKQYDTAPTDPQESPRVDEDEIVGVNTRIDFTDTPDPSGCDEDGEGNYANANEEIQKADRNGTKDDKL